jgi:hypothetical protein
MIRRLEAVLRIRIRMRMDPHDFGLLDPHPEPAIQMRTPDADADPDSATKFVLLIRSPTLRDKTF